MNINVQQIDRLLNKKKPSVRKATTEDIIFIKNELFSLLSDKRNDDSSKHIRQLLNEMHYLNIVVENEDEFSITYYYEPQKKYLKKISLNEAGWIEIDK